MANRYGLNDEPGLDRPRVPCDLCMTWYALIWHGMKLCKDCLKEKLWKS